MNENKMDHHTEEDFAPDAVMISSSSPYQATTEPVAHRRPFIGGFTIDMRYVKSPSGILKLIGITLSIAVAISLSCIQTCTTDCHAVTFIQTVCISELIFHLILYIMFSLSLHLKLEVIHWPFTDLIGVVLAAILYLWSSSMLAANVRSPAHSAACVFGFLCFLLFAASSWFAWKVLQVSRKKRQSTISHIKDTANGPENQGLA